MKKIGEWILRRDENYGGSILRTSRPRVSCDQPRSYAEAAVSWTWSRIRFCLRSRCSTHRLRAVFPGVLCILIVKRNLSIEFRYTSWIII